MQCVMNMILPVRKTFPDVILIVEKTQKKGKLTEEVKETLCCIFLCPAPLALAAELSTCCSSYTVPVDSTGQHWPP